MPIQPIDLQILFSHMHHVGKEQAAQKDAAVLQQSKKGNELIQQTRHQDESVAQSKEIEEEEGKVKNDEQQKKGSPNPDREKLEGGTEQSQEQGGRQLEFFQDPDLGKNVDISG